MTMVRSFMPGSDAMEMCGLAAVSQLTVNLIRKAR